MPNQIATVFQKEMTRKEFLVFVGLGLLAVIGITSRLKTITDLLHQPIKATKGFGKGAYGS